MRNQFFLSLLVAVVLAFTTCESEHFVTEQPIPPDVVVAPPPPGKIWVDYDYRWRGGDYIEVPRYAIKEKPNRIWVPGHWEHKPKGYVWVQGYWR